MADRTERLTAINTITWKYDPISRFWRGGPYVIRYNGWQYVAINRDTTERVAAGALVADVMRTVETIGQERNTDA